MPRRSRASHGQLQAPGVGEADIDVVRCDVDPARSQRRDEALLDGFALHCCAYRWSRGGLASSIDEIMAQADVVICNTGQGGVISPDQVREGHVIIALSEPRPEIEPYDAQLAGAAFAADGKAIAGSTAAPGVLLGALAVKATAISDDMRIAAAVTMAAASTDDDLVPTPLESGVHARIAAAVARVAVASGLSRITSDRLLTPEVFDEVIRDERQLPFG